jgi:aldehyde:ferredoxin oxidoreductase
LLGIPLPLIPHMRALELVTGERMRFGRFWTVGERGWALERALAVRFGVSAASDTLPERSLKEPLHPDEPRSVVPLDAMKPSYYRHRGWDVDGRPSDALLRRLGIPARGSAGG